MRFWYQASHPGAIAVGGGALLMSMERRVASPAKDPEQTVLVHVVWCLIVTFDAVWVCDMCAFELSDG